MITAGQEGTNLLLKRGSQLQKISLEELKVTRLQTENQLLGLNGLLSSQVSSLKDSLKKSFNLDHHRLCKTEVKTHNLTSYLSRGSFQKEKIIFVSMGYFQ